MDAAASLRTRLVQAGVDLLGAGDTQVLTLREIARQAGVSHGAPRRYFPTHLALLSAIAARGFDDLRVRVAPIVADDTAGPRAQLLALARAYVDFAAGNPGMFALMFRHDLLDSGLGLRETSLPMFQLLVDLVARVRAAPPPGQGLAAAPVVAAALWSNLHGIAQLGAWGSLQLTTGADTVEPVLLAALEAYLGPEK